MLQPREKNFAESLSAGGMNLTVFLAETNEDVENAQRLRYEVFANEMRANIKSVDGRDIDKYDEYCRHLLVRDDDSKKIVGCYRLLTQDGAEKLGEWYSQNEFDMSSLTDILPEAVEIGRACVHKDYRNGMTVMLLWNGLVRFLMQEKKKYLLGCASISLEDGREGVISLYQRLEKRYLAPEEYRVTPLVPIDMTPSDAPSVECPSLIKGYLRAGAFIGGEPSWDKDFNTADVLIIMIKDKIKSNYLKHFSKKEA